MGYTPPVPALIPQPDGTFSVRGWEVCVPGYWRKELLSRPRIAGIVRTYRLLKGMLGDRYTPKVRFGHDTQQRLATSLGLPNAGRVVDLRPTADGGFEIDTDGTPQKVLVWNPDEERAEVFDVLKAFKNRNWDGGSIELKRVLPNPFDPRQQLFDVFDGVALLGEEQPAIRTAAAIPHQAADTLTLAFSDFTAEVTTMTPRQKLAQIMGVDENDPSIAGMDDAAIAKQLANFGNANFADRYKACFADIPFNPMQVNAGPAAGAPNPPPALPPNPAAVNQEQPITMSADFMKRMEARQNALEAANDDLRKQLFAGGGAGMVTMSEANRRIDQCVKDGRVGVTKAIADAYLKPTAEKLLGLPADKAVFSDGDNKGKAQIAVFLAELEARPVDVMFSEIVDDTGDTGGLLDGLPAELTAEDRDILRSSNTGRSALRFYDDKRAAAATK